jgi:hypothetical protein
MIKNLPHLEFLPVEKMVIHEWHDDQRTPPLVERLRASGVFRNPPIVAPLLDGSDRSMVLDGANRTTALRQMGFPHVLAQVVHPRDSGLTLLNWNHVVWGLDPAEFRAGVEMIEDIELVQAERGRPDLWGDCGLAMVQLPRGDLFTVCTSAGELVRRVELLNRLVDSYKDRASLDRTSEWSVVRLKAVYPDLSGLVIFPRFDIDHVLQLAGAGCLLPTGITRFTVSPRALHLNYPLSELQADKPLEEKNAALQAWLQERIARKGVRYYAEATYLFDE